MKTKHDHKLTSLLKVLIFSVVMLAPFTAVYMECAYAICNPNAYQSYGGTYTLNKVFYEAMNNMTNSNLFNWAENTAIYTAINTMNTGLGISNPTLSLLLAYWSILMAVYIIFDIIIECFTYITHLLTTKKE